MHKQNDFYENLTGVSTSFQIFLQTAVVQAIIITGNYDVSMNLNNEVIGGNSYSNSINVFPIADGYNLPCLTHMPNSLSA